jgi:hypothetical protein
MRSPLQSLLTCLLAAVYGGLALLGPGLHLFLSDHGQHEDSDFVACATHASHNEAHWKDHLARLSHSMAEAFDQAGEPAVHATNCVSESHACPVCHFVASARGVPPRLAPDAARPHVNAIVLCASQRFSTPIYLGPQAPRAPPLAHV